jgi:hypothetical protein
LAEFLNYRVNVVALLLRKGGAVAMSQSGLDPF